MEVDSKPDPDPESNSIQDEFLTKHSQSKLVSVGIIELDPFKQDIHIPTSTSTSSSSSIQQSQSFLPLSSNAIHSLAQSFNIPTSRSDPSSDFFAKLATLISCNLIRISAAPSNLLHSTTHSSSFLLRIHLVTQQNIKSKDLQVSREQDDQSWRKAGLPISNLPFQPLFNLKTVGTAKQALLEVLETVRVDQKAWKASCVAEGGESEKLDSDGQYFFDESKDIDSLQRIYHELPSPTPDDSLLDSSPTWVQDLLSSSLTSTGPPGLKSSLYPYQKRTLWKLLQKELAPQFVEDPSFINLHSSFDSSTYYLDPRTLRVSLSNTFASQREVKGGILSELMGTGKTIISLALILSTKGMLPDLRDTEQSSFTSSNVTSEVAQTFPGDDQGADPASFLLSESLEELPYYSSASKPTDSDSGFTSSSYQDQTSNSDSPDSMEQSQYHKPLPRLVDLCVHSIRTSQIPIDYLGFISRNPVPSTLQTLLTSRATPFYNLWPPLPTRTSRVPIDRSPLRIFLSPATLVVVPLTLLRQWRTQIDEHCHPGSLRCLFLENASDPIPDARELAENWDLILLSHTRFGKERSDGKIHRNWSTVPRKCICPYWKATRIRNCSCPAVPERGKAEISPLLLCKFKRLIVDEGDVLKGNSGLVDLACALSSDSKWLVSGTPVESLVGSTQSLSESTMTREKIADAGTEARIWSNLERKDLERLKKILVSFLKLPPFYSFPGSDTSQTKDWTSVVSAGLMGSSSSSKPPEWGACRRLSSILNRVIVRNRTEDVEKNCPLPPIHFKVQRLSFSNIERLTFNSLNALITLNAVWTQREDEDYFFHHQNRKHLLGIMENIALACFHFTGQELIPQLMEAADHARKQLLKPKWNALERAEAEEALTQIESSLQSSAWRSHIETADVTYSIQDLNRQIIQSWSRKYGDRSGLSGEEILRMRRAMSKIVGKQDEKEELDEEILSEELITAGALDLRRWQESEAKSSTKKRKISEITDSSTSLNLLSSPTKKIKAKVSQSQSNQVAAILGQERQEGSSKKESTSKKGKGKSRDLALIDLGHRIPSSLTLSEARINGVSSTKLQFLIDEIRSLPADDKALVFSSHDNVLFELGNALELAACPHLIIAAGVNQSRRNEFIAAFSAPNSSVRLLLMKTSISSKGLDLGSANHVYFMDPIFDSSLELQALKRAYRLGQKKEVFVTRVVMKDTFEDEMLKRREELESQSSSDSAGKAGAWNDERMRHFISHPKFVEGGDGGDFDAAHLALGEAMNAFLVSEENAPQASTSTIPLSPPISPSSSALSGPSSISTHGHQLPLITPPDVPLRRDRPTSPTPQSSIASYSSIKRPKKQVKFSG